jgi:hypothetical protein
MLPSGHGSQQLAGLRPREVKSLTSLIQGGPLESEEMDSAQGDQHQS